MWAHSCNVLNAAGVKDFALFVCMVFTAKKVELPTFGEKLKKAREEAGLSKQKVTQLLNIQAKYLEILEQGEIEKMPADVYVKGFLKKYAKILGIDADVLIGEYENEIKIAQHLNKQKHQSLPRLHFRRFTVTPRFLGIIFGIIIFLLVGGYLFYQFNFLISPPKLTIREPIDNLTTDKTTVIIKGQTEPGAKLTINGQPVYINKDGGFEQEVNLNQGLNLIKIEAANRFAKSRAETRKILVK